MKRTSFRKRASCPASRCSALAAVRLRRRPTRTTASGDGDGSGSDGGLSAAPQRRRRLLPGEGARAPGPSASRTPTPASTVNYDPVGSGDGRENFVTGGFPLRRLRLRPRSTTRASSPRPRSAAAARPIEVPAYVCPIAVVFNLPGVDGLNLSPDTIARHLRRQDHLVGRPGDRRGEPGRRRCPSAAITPVHRSDESGTTEQLHRLPHRGRARRLGRRRRRGVARSRRRRGRRRHLRRRPAGHATARTRSATPTPSQAGDLAGRQRRGRRRVRRARRPRPPPRSSRPPAARRGPPARPTWPSTLDRTTTEAGAYPVVLTSYLLACPTYDDAGRRPTSSRVTRPTSSATRARSRPPPRPAPRRSRAELPTRRRSIIDGITAG